MPKRYRPRSGRLSASTLAAIATALRARSGKGRRHPSTGSKRKHSYKSSTNKKPRNAYTNSKAKSKGREKISAGNNLVSNTYSIQYLKPSKASKTLKLLGPLDVDRAMTSQGMSKPGTGVQLALSGGETLRNPDLTVLYNRAIATNTTYQAAAAISGNNQDYKMEVVKWENEYTIVNQMPGMVKIEIYDCICRTQQSPSAILCWEQGIERAGGIDNTQELTSFPGSSPMDSSYFRRNWRIYKKTSIYLNTGGTHMHTFRRHLHKKFSVLDFNSKQAVGINRIPGMTTDIIFVVNGFPVDNLASNTSTGLLVTTDAAKIIWTNRQTVTTRIYSTKSKHIEYNNALPVLTENAYGQNVDGSGIHDTLANVANLAQAIS